VAEWLTLAGIRAANEWAVAAIKAMTTTTNATRMSPKNKLLRSFGRFENTSFIGT
jgi:hypothetical protein